MKKFLFLAAMIILCSCNRNSCKLINLETTSRSQGNQDCKNNRSNFKFCNDGKKLHKAIFKS